MRNVVFVGCVKKKNKGPMKAVDKYNSDLFRKEITYARQLTSDDNIYILSAKYGIITLDTVIDDYNLYLSNFKKREKKEWADRVIEQAKKLNIDKSDHVTFLCGNHYSEYLKEYYSNYEDPTEGLTIGYTLAWFKDHINKDELKENNNELNLFDMCEDN